MKECKKCKIEKEEIEFSNPTWCKKCVNEYSKRRYYQMRKTRNSPVENKICVRCKILKSNEEFHRKIDSKDGLLAKCKDCISAVNGRNRIKSIVVKLENHWPSYLAGLIDGEGHIGLGRKGTATRYHVRCVVGMTGNFLENLATKLNMGTIRKVTSPSRLAKHKSVTTWSFSSNECRWLLPQLKPFLILKKEQCQLIMDYLELASHKDKSEEYSQKTLRIYDKLRALNKRGV